MSQIIAGEYRQVNRCVIKCAEHYIQLICNSLECRLSVKTLEASRMDSLYHLTTYPL